MTERIILELLHFPCLPPINFFLWWFPPPQKNEGKMNKQSIFFHESHFLFWYDFVTVSLVGLLGLPSDVFLPLFSSLCDSLCDSFWLSSLNKFLLVIKYEVTVFKALDYFCKKTLPGCLHLYADQCEEHRKTCDNLPIICAMSWV